MTFLSTLSLRRATFRRYNGVGRAIGFLSTLSLRRATSSKIISSSITTYFYPRSPCGERRPRPQPPKARVLFLSTLSLRRATATDISARREASISIHALLAESDSLILPPVDTSSVISIHALLAESDAPPYNLMIHQKNFYPRSPCGERHVIVHSAHPHKSFLSTLSLRRAT